MIPWPSWWVWQKISSKEIINLSAKYFCLEFCLLLPWTLPWIWLKGKEGWQYVSKDTATVIKYLRQCTLLLAEKEGFVRTQNIEKPVLLAVGNLSQAYSFSLAITKQLPDIISFFRSANGTSHITKNTPARKITHTSLKRRSTWVKMLWYTVAHFVTLVQTLSQVTIWGRVRS